MLGSVTRKNVTSPPHHRLFLDALRRRLPHICASLQREAEEMPRNTGDEERLTEDEIARRKLGPRGVPGGPDTSKMTPQQKKNIPKTGEFDGHTA